MRYKHMYVHRKTHRWMYTEVYFIIAKIEKNPYIQQKNKWGYTQLWNTTQQSKVMHSWYTQWYRLMGTLSWMRKPDTKDTIPSI